MSRANGILLIAIQALLVTACDPAGPGASGTIAIGAGLDATKYRSLVVRAIPDDGKPFDVARPAAMPAGEGRWEGFAASLPVTLPRSYNIGLMLGTTQVKKWRVVAWLSRTKRTERTDYSAVLGPDDFPKSGEPFGTTTFDVSSCGLFVGGYCAKTGGVDLTINTMVP